MNDKMLIFEAKSFYNAYIALEQLERKEDHPEFLYFFPMVVNGAFSIEITIKAMLTKNHIDYGKEHNLLVLFQLLPEAFQCEIIERVKEIAPEYADRGALDNELILVSNAFVDFRYGYESGSMPALNIRFLSVFANASICTMFSRYNVSVQTLGFVPESDTERVMALFRENREAFTQKNLKIIRNNNNKKSKA